MKKVNLLLFAFIMLLSTGFAQTQKTVWPEMNAFHSLMSTSFHAVEEGNYAPLKENAEQMYYASKKWMNSPVPANLKNTDVMSNVEKLLKQCNKIWSSVAKNASNETLKTMITAAHDTYHTIAGECQKSEK
jgi:hypothetical protein